MNTAEILLGQKLHERRLAGNYRSLKIPGALVDFCSNDYLGFARSRVLAEAISAEMTQIVSNINGSTGSRLLTGNSAYAEQLEQYIAQLYSCEGALVFNSGYDANVGIFSSVPQRGDTIITDELIHASIIDGARLSYANRFIFKHNDADSLREKLQHAKGNCYVAIESVYSMDGDGAPINDILAIVEQYGANLIVDEAHALGLYGLGLVSDDIKHRVFARIITFGKALGCHGAVVLGSNLLKDYLVNFARSFIYTTAASPHQLVSIKKAFEFLIDSTEGREMLRLNINRFKAGIQSHAPFPLIKSDSAIQCLLLKSNERAKALAAALQTTGLDVRPILSPTVAAGTERIRVCLHSFNTFDEIDLLTYTINRFINAE